MTHHKRIVTIIAGLAAMTGALPGVFSARAAAPSDFVDVSGTFRIYSFNKEFSALTKTNQHSAAAGAIVRLTTAPFLGGFGLGVGFYGAGSLESFPAGAKNQETTLIGSASSLTTIGEAYLQYARDGALLRAGRQLINTPWIGARDSRMLPQTFEGVWGQMSPAKGWHLMAMRLTKFKSRTSGGFHRDNLFYPTGYEDDSLYGVTKAFPKKALLPEAKGTAAGGVRYATKSAYADVWYYDYYDFARTTYADGDYTFGGRKQTWRPYLDGQFMSQSGGDLLTRDQAALFGQGGSVDSTLWGLRSGLKAKGINLSLSYDKLEDHAGSYGGGAIVSPYGNDTAMFAAVMSNDLLGYGPGEVVQLADVQTFLHKQLKLKVAVLRFRTTFSGDPTVLYVDPTYSFSGMLKGLSLRDRLAWSNGAASAGGRALIYNRVMVQYRF